MAWETRAPVPAVSTGVWAARGETNSRKANAVFIDSSVECGVWPGGWRTPAATQLYSQEHHRVHHFARPEGAARGQRYPDDHRQPHRQVLRGTRQRRHHPGGRSQADQDDGRRFRVDDVRPRLHEHRGLPQRHHLYRRRQGHPALPGLPHRAARRAVHLSRGGLPAVRGRAARHDAAPHVDGANHLSHIRPHEHHQVSRGVPLRRPSHGDAARCRWRALDLLPRRQAHPRSGQSLPPAPPAPRQGAHHRRLCVPAFPRTAARLPGQRSGLYRQLRRT